MQIRKFGKFRTILNQDTFQFALAHSTFVGLYLFLTRVLQASSTFSTQNERNRKAFTALVAGTVAGSSILLDKNRSRRQNVAIYLSVRATYFSLRWAMTLLKASTEARRAVRIADESGKVVNRKESSAPAVGKKSLLNDTLPYIVLKWGNMVPLCLVLAQITYAVNLMPNTLPAAYFKFLISIHRLKLKYGSFASSYLGCTNLQLKNLIRSPASANHIPAGLASAAYVPNLFEDKEAREGIRNIFRTRSNDVRGGLTEVIRHDYVACALQHPDSASCFVGAFEMAQQVFSTSVKMYATFYAIAMAFGFLRKSLWNRNRDSGCPTKPSDPPTADIESKNSIDPLKKSLYLYFTSVLRSSSWIGLFIFIGRYAICLQRRMRGGEESGMSYIVAGALGALGGLVEKQGRRVDLTLFLSVKAVESAWKCVTEWGWCKGIRNGEVVLHSIAMGVIMSLYETKNPALTKMFRRVLEKIVG